MNLKTVKRRTAYTADKRNKADNYKYLNENFCKTGQTVLAGDSITEFYNHTELFQQYSEKTGLIVYNRGIGGDTSDRLLERFEENVLNISPRNIVLLIGTNDLGIGASIDFSIDNIEKIIDLTQSKCADAKVIVLAVYPINDADFSKGRRKNKDIIRLNMGLGRLCKMKNVDFVDLTALLSDEDGNLNKCYTYDGLHINAKAYRIVTDNIIPYLK